MSRDPFDFLGGLDDDFAGGQLDHPSDWDRAALNKIEADADRFFDEQDAIAPPPAPGATFTEKCRKCNGSGGFYSGRMGYSDGRYIGKCFACKGVGSFERKTSPEARAKARATTAARKERIMTETREAFAIAHPAEWAWMGRKSGTFNFALAMIKAVEDFGDLTERQMETVQRLMAADAARDADRAAERAKRDAAAPAVSTDKLMAAFDAAVGKGIKRPKMRFEGFTASLAPATGKNPGAVYIKAAGDVYLGKIAGGRFMASREATEAQQADVVATMADPLKAAVAFGRRTGECSCCGRELTNALSIELGIGPICRERFGL